jgi:flagellar biosynthesis protein FlhG
MERMFTQENKFVKTIAVTGGKGGIGAANVTVNLALAMSKIGRKVLIMAADLGLGDIEVLLHVSPKYHIQHLLNNALSLKDILVEGPKGIKILSAGHESQKLAALTEFQQLKLVEMLDARIGDIDVLLIDAASEISENVAFFCSAAQEIIILTSPERASIADASAFITVLYSRHQELQFHVLVDSAKNPESSLEAFRRLSFATEHCQSISLDYLGFLPQDDAVRAAKQAKQAFVERYPRCPASIKISEISEKLLNSGDRVKGSLQFCIGQLLTTSAGSHR